MESLKVYYFEFDALWMGGNALIVAENKLDAELLLENRYKEQFKNGKLEINKVKEININNKGVKVFYDGDY